MNRDLDFIVQDLVKRQSVPILGFVKKDFLDTGRIVWTESNLKGLSFDLYMNDDDDENVTFKKRCLLFGREETNVDYLCNWFQDENHTVSGHAVEKIPGDAFSQRFHDYFMQDVVFIRNKTGERLSLPLFTGRSKDAWSRRDPLH